MADDDRAQTDGVHDSGPVAAGVNRSSGRSGSPPAGDALTEYGQRKLQLAELIRGVMSVAAERRDDEKRAEAQQLLARLAEDRFQLAVVGQFSRGKSTLMNAILGHPYLPTGALPMTSVVTSVRYGSRPRAFVQRAGSTFPIETPLDDLVRFVAQASHEREQLRVVSAEVEVPAEILRLGFWFVDTPGVGSAVAANTATTESFLPEADAVIFVTSFDAPLSEAEVGFLAKVRHHVEKLFLVVNKRDLVSVAEAESVLRYVRERLATDGGDPEPRVFATSARRALEARMSGDHAGLATSGLPELERPLVRFLTTEKSRVFLLQVSGRTERLIARQRLDLELGRLARSHDRPQRDARRGRLDEQLTGLAAEVSTVASDLRRQIEANFPVALAERSSAWPEEVKQLAHARAEPPSPEALEGTVRTRLEVARAAMAKSAQASADAWLRERLPEARALLLELAGDHITRLHALHSSVEAIAAEAFGLSPPAVALEPTPWSPSELPQFAVRPVAFTARLELPWWFSVCPAGLVEANGRARLLAAIEEGTLAYCDAARHALAEAANIWVQAYGTRMERETGEAAEDLRQRLQLPGSERHLALLDEIEQRLAGCRAELAAWEPGTTVAQAPDADEPPRPSEPPRVAAPCVVCERIGEVPFDYLADVQYDLATRQSSRRHHAEAGGFCVLHTWQYSQVASDLGIALSYAELAGAASERLRRAARTESAEPELRAAVQHFLPDPARCPVCVAVAEAQRDAVSDLVKRVSTGRRDDAPPPLCMPHLAAVVAADPGVEGARWLATGLADVLERAAEDMRTYALKRESLRQYLVTDEERAAQLQVIARVAGYRELARPWRLDDRLAG
jgi:ribosome biogenesis GTPase A